MGLTKGEKDPEKLTKLLALNWVPFGNDFARPKKPITLPVLCSPGCPYQAEVDFHPDPQIRWLWLQVIPAAGFYSPPSEMFQMERYK